MRNFVDLCQKYYKTDDFYEVLKVKRDATEKEGLFKSINFKVNNNRNSELIFAKIEAFGDYLENTALILI